MADSMRRRGPDGMGLRVAGNVGMGHRRLKIIDLSEASAQPMHDAKLGLSVAYNGAIYNFRELRRELEGHGYEFFSDGDTEVLLKAYHAWGPEFVRRLNGMFAFAIAERESGRVVMARDRLGIKPLYFTESARKVRFASTLPALLAAGDVDTAIDAEALACYLHFHSVVPPPRTILQGVRKLPPATLWTIEPDGRQTRKCYWEPVYGVPEERTNWTEGEWKEATLEVMRAAVRRRLVADVPVGVLLSGGLDSSLIVGLLAEQGAGRIETFSIGFESVGGEEGDEFKYSDIIASRFATEHHKMQIPADRTLPALPECIAAMSEPMVSHDNVGFYLLSREVARFVKVVQSGQGADEIFGGYHWYPPMMDTNDAFETYRAHFFDRDEGEYRQLVAEPWVVEGNPAARFVRGHFASPGAELPIDKALRIDARIMLADDPVKRVDNHTMAAGLEARVPFLDHEVVEFAAGIPAGLKIRDDGKFILKEAARRVIPAGVIDRPKGYFPVPALKYLRGEFLEFARGALLNDAARARGLFQSAEIGRYLEDPGAHITPLRGSKLWQCALLELWLQAHGI
jgi:asparagine synthase (glutamine-hydrolysing)